MAEFSLINQKYIMNSISGSNNQAAVKNAAIAAKNSNLAPLEQDCVEIASKKLETNDIFSPFCKFFCEETASKKTEKDFKKLFLIGAGIGVAMAGVYGLIKCHNTNKIKKLITEQYDKLADDVAEKMKKDGFDFVKPELKFERFSKNIRGCYQVQDNSILVNANNLSLKNYYKLIDKNNCVYSSMLGATNCENINLFTYLSPKIAKKHGLKKGTLDEFVMDKTVTLAHELEHARQTQLSLHAEGAHEFLLESLKKKNPKLSIKDIKKRYSFVFSFSPEKKISLDQYICSRNDIKVKVGKGRELKSDIFKLYGTTKDGSKIYVPVFTPKGMLESMYLNYQSSDSGYTNYITNICETYARRAERDVFEKMTFKGVDEETLLVFREIKNFNYNELIKFLLESAK